MNKLDVSDDCFKLNSINYDCPTVADNMMLTALTKKAGRRRGISPLHILLTSGSSSEIRGRRSIT